MFTINNIEILRDTLKKLSENWQDFNGDRHHFILHFDVDDRDSVCLVMWEKQTELEITLFDWRSIDLMINSISSFSLGVYMQAWVS